MGVPELDHCGKCGQGNPPFVCSKCLYVAYCSPECQKLAWSAHKLTCGKQIPAPAPTPASQTQSHTVGQQHIGQDRHAKANAPRPPHDSRDDIIPPTPPRQRVTATRASHTPGSSSSVASAMRTAGNADNDDDNDEVDDNSDAESFTSVGSMDVEGLNVTYVDNKDVFETSDFDPHLQRQGQYSVEQLLERDSTKENYIVEFLDIDELITTAAWVLHQAFAYRADERLFLARRLLEVVRSSYRRCLPLLQVSRDDRLPKILALQHYFETNRKIQGILQEAHEADEVLHFLEPSDEWRLVRQTKQIGTWFRYEEGSTKCAMKVVGDVPVNAVSCVALLAEIDLAHMWIPRTQESTQVEAVNMCSKTAYLSLGFTWPMWNRDMFVYGCGYDLSEDGHIMVVLKSIENNEFHGGRIVRACKDPPKRHVRMELLTSGYKFDLLAPNRTRVTILLHSDPKIGFIPDSVLNFMSRQLAFLAMVFFRKTANNVTRSSIHAQRISQNPRLYGMILERTQGYFADPANHASVEEYQPTEEEIAARAKIAKKGKKELTLLLDEIEQLWPDDVRPFEKNPVLVDPPDPYLNVNHDDEI